MVFWAKQAPGKTIFSALVALVALGGLVVLVGFALLPRSAVLVV